MSKIKNSGLDQYGAEPLEQQHFGTAVVEGVSRNKMISLTQHILMAIISHELTQQDHAAITMLSPPYVSPTIMPENIPATLSHSSSNTTCFQQHLTNHHKSLSVNIQFINVCMKSYHKWLATEFAILGPSLTTLLLTERRGILVPVGLPGDMVALLVK